MSLWSLLHLAKITHDVIKSPESRKPMSPLLALGIVIGVLVFFGIFGYYFVTGRIR